MKSLHFYAFFTENTGKKLSLKVCDTWKKNDKKII